MEVEQVMYILMVQDMDRAVEFYANVIGFRTRSHSARWSELAFGDFTLALHIGEKGGGRSTGLAFTVSDLDAACKEVEAGGGEVIKGGIEGPVAGLRRAIVVDAEGNSLELGQYTA